MKNIYETKKNGKKYWVVGYTDPFTQKETRRFFKNRELARQFNKNRENEDCTAIDTIKDIPAGHLRDVLNALQILPKGKSLEESVKKAWLFYSPISLSNAIEEYIHLKEVKVAEKEISITKHRLSVLKSLFPQFEDITPDKLKELLNTKRRNKTITNWKGSLNEFFKYCQKKEYIKENPFDKIIIEELLKKEEKHKINIISVSIAKEFMHYLEKEYPSFVRYFALALFAGIRIAEIPRLEDRFFDYQNKRIIFPAEIGKVKKAWTLDDLPENLWMWLGHLANFV